MPGEMSDPIRDAIQQVLDDAGDGWTLSAYVVGMNLERFDGDELRCAKWWTAPPDQHRDFTQALVAYLADATQPDDDTYYDD